MEKKPITWINREAILDTIVFLCGFLFVFSALDKLANYQGFRVQIGKSPVLTGYEDVLVWAVPVSELLIVAAMLRMKTRLYGLYTFFTIMLVFIGYIILLSHLSPDLPCGCNFLTEKLSPGTHILLNSVFAAMAAAGVLLYDTSDITRLKMEVRDNK